MFYIQYTSSAASQGQKVEKYIIGFLFYIIQQHKAKMFCRQKTCKKIIKITIFRKKNSSFRKAQKLEFLNTTLKENPLGNT